MTKTFAIAAAAIAITAGSIGTSVASPSKNLGAEISSLSQSLTGWPELSAPGATIHRVEDHTQVAVNRIIRIGPRSAAKRPTKCYVTIYGDRYYSEAITEQVARARLAAITDQYIYCRKEKYRY